MISFTLSNLSQKLFDIQVFSFISTYDINLLFSHISLYGYKFLLLSKRNFGQNVFTSPSIQEIGIQGGKKVL